jgi:hypothetical protein
MINPAMADRVASLAATVTPLGLGQALITVDTGRNAAWVQAVVEVRAAVSAG